jgi:hypothetical protein
MIDTSGIDIKAVIDQMTAVAWGKPVRSHGEMVYKGGPCPFCHLGTDRFAVFVEGEKPHFYSCNVVKEASKAGLPYSNILKICL